MRKALESGDPAEREVDLPLHPTRSGRSLKYREVSPIERRQERREAAEIAALKARIDQQSSIESQWKIARDEVAAQKLARTADAARMAAQIAVLENRVEMAASRAAGAVAAVSKQRDAWRATAATLGVMAVGLLGISLWPSRGAQATLAQQSVAQQFPRDPAPSKVRRLRNSLPQDAHAALTTALDHLNGALETVPRHTPEQALRNAADTEGCSIVWTDEIPSVVFGTALGPNSIATTLEQCAEAVEDLR